MSGITVSKKHGVNPSVLICPVCHGDTGGLALLGRLKDDAEAPRKMLDRNPCPKCLEVLERGAVFLVEVKDGETGNNPYRTGLVVGVKREAIEKLMPDLEKSCPMVYVEESTLKIYMGDQYGKIFNKLDVDGSDGPDGAEG